MSPDPPPRLCIHRTIVWGEACRRAACYGLQRLKTSTYSSGYTRISLCAVDEKRPVSLSRVLTNTRPGILRTILRSSSNPLSSAISQRACEEPPLWS
jgi:hypothetical protein